jgi:hypothetical protein
MRGHAACHNFVGQMHASALCQEQAVAAKLDSSNALHVIMDLS